MFKILDCSGNGKSSNDKIFYNFVNIFYKRKKLGNDTGMRMFRTDQEFLVGAFLKLILCDASSVTFGVWLAQECFFWHKFM